MKKLIIILFILIQILPLKNSIAGECIVESDVPSALLAAFQPSDRTMVFCGIYATKAEAESATYSCSSGEPLGTSNKTISTTGGTIKSVYRHDTALWTLWIAGYYSDSSNCMDSLPDQDSDGIPDECDFYPDDPTSYSIRKISYMSDGSFAVYQTNRGDYFGSGTLADGAIPDVYNPNAAYQPPPTECGSFEGAISESVADSGGAPFHPDEFNSDDYENPPIYLGDWPTWPVQGTDYGEAGGTGPGIAGMPQINIDYTLPSGGESDSALLQSIAVNTAQTANAVSVLNANQAANNSLLAQAVNNTAAQVEATSALGEAIEIVNTNVEGLSENMQKMRINSELAVGQNNQMIDGIQGINDGVDAMNNTMSGKLDNIETAVNNMSSGIGDKLDTLNTTTDEINQGIDELTDPNNWDSSGIPESGLPDYATELNTVMDALTSENTLNDTPDNTTFQIDGQPGFSKGLWDMESIIINWITGSGITSLLSTEDWQVGGSPSFTWSYAGKTIEFTIEPYANALNVWGSVIMAFSGVCAVLIVFKR